MKIKEKIKKFWNEFKEHWLWVTIGIYIGAIIIGWVEYIRGYIILLGILLATFISPLIIFIAYDIRKSERTNLVYRVIWVVSGGAALGWVIWAFISIILIATPWSPFRELQGILRMILLILTIVPSYIVAGYIIYRWGKKRDFRPYR